MDIFQIEQKHIDGSEILRSEDLGKYCYLVNGEFLGFFNTSRDAFESTLNILRISEDEIRSEGYLEPEHLGKWAYLGSVNGEWRLQGFYDSQREAIAGYKLSRSIS
ncbi:MAG: hypothetical protein RMY36_023240 [Nostoc sp. SerVER01]|nr:hypothetical protein [Nostoc sp. SerVER01]